MWKRRRRKGLYIEKRTDCRQRCHRRVDSRRKPRLGRTGRQTGREYFGKASWTDTFATARSIRARPEVSLRQAILKDARSPEEEVQKKSKKAERRRRPRKMQGTIKEIRPAVQDPKVEQIGGLLARR